MTTPTILLVDDELAIGQQLQPFLERAGYAVALAHDGLAALDAVSELRPDLIVMDVLMPRLDGRAALRRLRQAADWTPVILLTQVGDSTERALALTEGADDYLNKPFDPHELLARIQSILRRSRPGQPSLASGRSLSSDGLVLDRSSRRALLAGKDLLLTPRSVTLLEYLMLHPDEAISRERLLDAVWGWDYAAGTRAVDARIAEIRRALGQHATAIETVPGHGYRFAGRVESAR
ncbi:MAG TPA: response regulator transcription factor [Herpetosiphonaceae bacterium]|nr:response regulator transcription factor [Herpetosiphonaceae bacterium]